jgi:soluble lytic murein transglycosylase-like protein
MLEVVSILIMSAAAAAPMGAAAAAIAAPAAVSSAVHAVSPARSCHFRPSGDEHDPMAMRLAFFADRLGVPPAFALAIAHHESRFHPDAISPKGAVGLMQIMPGTAIEYDADETSLHDPDVNMYTGLRILRDLLAQFDGREPLAAAAYVAGPGFWAKQYSPSVGREIEDYVSSVMALRDEYFIAISCR